MVDFKNEQLYRQDSVDKQLQITFDGGTITNKEIPSEQFELTESLSSDSQLVFGSCEASEIRFRIYNVFTPLKDKWLTVTQTLNGDTENPLQIGKYKVFSDKPTADRSYRDVVAYDAMYDIINTDVASWYNGLTFPMSLKAFRDSFFAFFGIEQEDVLLVNDVMEIERTIEPQTLSGRDVIASICELNGCFGNIGRNGKFQYITLKKITSGIYPSNDIYPADNLFPQQPNMQMLGSGLYVSPPTYEDFTVKPIDKLQIREKEGDIGVIVGNGDNTYIVEDNFLVYGKSAEDVTLIANNMLSVIKGLEYRPFDAKLVGNPCFEVGDVIRLHTKYQVIDSYVLQRTLSGIQALRDSFSADGEEYQTEKVNDIQTQIIQLKGKTNTLERTVDETKSTISDVESGLQSEITQTADRITSTVSETQSKWELGSYENTPLYYGYGEPTIPAPSGPYNYIDVVTGEVYSPGVVEGGSPRWYKTGQLQEVKKVLQSSIDQTAQSIRMEVSNIEDDLYSSIAQTAQSIRLEVAEETNELSSEIEQLANQIVLSVDANGKIVLVELSADPSTGSEFKVEADNINLSANDVINLLAGGTINLSGKNISITSTNFTVDSQTGNVTISGTIKGSSGEFTKGFSVNIPYGNYRWLMNASTSGCLMGFYLNNTPYAALNLGQGTASLSSYQGVTIDGGRGSVQILSSAPVSLPSAVMSGSLTMGTNNINISDGAGVYGSNNSQWLIRPYDGANYNNICALGDMSHVTSLYGSSVVLNGTSTAVTSDKRLKKDFTEFDERYEEFFLKLKPLLFKYLDSNSDRFHSGFVAQDVRDMLIECGLTTKDFAAYMESKADLLYMEEAFGEDAPLGVEDTQLYLRYEEFIALITHMTQRAYEKIEAQQLEIDTLKEQVSFLMQKLGDEM